MFAHGGGCSVPVCEQFYGSFSLFGILSIGFRRGHAKFPLGFRPLRGLIGRLSVPWVYIFSERG
jgi:hypothetical protein